jgi:hypothetical protein
MVGQVCCPSVYKLIGDEQCVWGIENARSRDHMSESLRNIKDAIVGEIMSWR